MLNSYDFGIFAVILNLHGDNIPDCGRCGKEIADRRSLFSSRKWMDLVDLNISYIAAKQKDNYFDKAYGKAVVTEALFTRPFRKVKRFNSEIFNKVNDEFSRFRKVELCKPNLDEILAAYEAFARQTFCVLHNITNDHLELIVALNRWIYWVDAINDIDEDIKSHNYNPFVNHINTLDKASFLIHNYISIQKQFNLILGGIKFAYNECEYPKTNRMIIENLIDFALPSTTSLIITGKNLPKRRKLL